MDVCGAVARPGVYALETGSRVFQAVEKAGGFLPEAAGTYINQAQTLSDGQQIYVPTKEKHRRCLIRVRTAATLLSAEGVLQTLRRAEKRRKSI